MRRALLLSILSFSAFSVWAQQAGVHRYTTPLAGQAVLRDVDDKYNAQVYNIEMPDPDAAEEQVRLAALKKQVQAMYPRKKQQQSAVEKTTQAQKPVIQTSFIADSLPGIPPDNYMAINTQHQAVSVINSIITVHNAQTGQIVTRKGLKQFSQSVGLNNLLTDYRYDPKIIYDPEADRFISIMLNGTLGESYIVVGFSKSNDPTGAWNFYKFYGDYKNDTTWFDYPSVTVTHNEFFFTGNKVRFDSSWQAGFKNSVIYQVRKQDGYNGDTALTYQIWDSVQYNGNYIRNLFPLNPGSAVQGPAQYFLSDRDFYTQNDSIYLIKIPDTIGSANNNLTVTALTSSVSYGVPPDGLQPDTSVTLATNDNRVLGGYIEGNEIQFVSTTINPATGNSAIYHGRISNYNTTPTLQASIYGIDSLDLGYPNISYTGNQGNGNQSIISFDYTGAHTYPGFGAIFFDGSQYSDMTNIISGDSSINILTGQEQRWGDYSGSQPDWSAMGTVWVEGIFGRKNKDYGNYMAQLASPYYTGVPTVSKGSNPAVLYPNPAWQFIRFEFEMPADGLATFAIYNATGQLVDKILQQHCDEGKNLIQFNIAPLHTGTYFLKAVDQQGKTISVNSFIRQ